VLGYNPAQATAATRKFFHIQLDPSGRTAAVQEQFAELGSGGFRTGLRFVHPITESGLSTPSHAVLGPTRRLRE